MDLQKVIQLYKNAPLRDRFHVAVRWSIAPFTRLDEFIPSKGLLVDVGCGHGLFAFHLASQKPELGILAYDPSEWRIQLASKVADDQGVQNICFRVGGAPTLSIPDCDAVTFLDILYLLPLEVQEDVLKIATHHLHPKGKILIKEMSRTPVWKYWWNCFEEVISVKILHFTEAENFNFRPEEEWMKILERLGLEVRTVRVDQGYVHPHVLIIGEKL